METSKKRTAATKLILKKDMLHLCCISSLVLKHYEAIPAVNCDHLLTELCYHNRKRYQMVCEVAWNRIICTAQLTYRLPCTP